MTASIAFDLGNVLLPFDHLSACRKLAQASGKAPHEVYDHLFGSDLAREFECGRIQGQEFDAGVRQALDLPLSYSKSELRMAWCDIFEESAPMHTLIEELSGQTPMCLVSNTNAWHFEWILSQYAVVRLFDIQILSYEVGVMKPDGAIYAAASRALGNSEPKIFVDDLQENVVASQAAGFKGIVFENAAQLRRDLIQLGVSINP